MDGIDPLEVAGASLAMVVAAIHLYWGLPRLLTYAFVGGLPDPRPPAFVLSALLIAVGVALAAAGAPRRPIYLAGIALVLAYLLGYVAWHTVLAHGAFWPWAPGIHHHGQGPVETVLSHLATDPFELASKLAELALLAVLVALYRRDVR